MVGRAELIASIIIGAILGLVGFEFARDSVQRLIDHESVVFGSFAMWVTVVSIFAKEALAQYSFWGSKKTGNPSLKADGWHHRSDAISSVIILIGIFLGDYFWWIDGVLGLVVSMLIFYAAFETIKDCVDPLMGEKPSDQLSSDLRAIAYAASGMDTKLHHIHIHRYGDHIELTAHIILPGDITLEKAHQIADTIEKDIGDKLKIEATIHMEPF